MKGHLRWRGQSIEVRVHAGGSRYVTRTVRWQGTKTATKNEADRVLRALLDELDVGSHGGPNATVAQLVARWRSHAEKDWSPTTRSARDSYLRNHILPALGDRKVREVRTADIDDLYKALRAKGLSVATIRRSVHTILRTAFGEAVRWRWITYNPVLDAKPPKRGGDLPDLHPPTDADLDRLLALAVETNLDLLAFIAIAADTGARRGEVCALRWSKVDLDVGEVLIDKAIVLDDGVPVEKDTKTHQARRLALSSECVGILRAHRVRVLERAMAQGAKVRADGYLFSPAADLTGVSPWRPDGATSRFMRLRDRAGLPNVRLHDLRHALATDMLAAGVDPRTVMGRGGWSSLQILTRYSHFVAAKDREAADQLGGRLRAAT